VLLSDLDPRWIDRPLDSRWKVGVSFRCTHCSERCLIFFKNPLDGGPPKGASRLCLWTVVGGSDFSDLHVVPSVDWKDHMHASLVQGRVEEE
jgi:hypothetical protein